MLMMSSGMAARLLGPEAFEQILKGAQVRVFTGTRPASADQPETINGASLLGYITLAGIAPGLAGAGLNFTRSEKYIITPPYDEWILAVWNTGEVMWFRICLPADDGGVSSLQPRFDGDAGIDSTICELVLPYTSVTAGDVIAPLSFFYTFPPI